MTGFTEQALIFIGASLLLVPLFQKLGFGSVLGYLIAGIVVGPEGLGLIQDPLSHLHFAEFGVVMLLFVIGLEIQPRKLWSMRRLLFGLGGMQIASCAVVFTGIAMLMGLSLSVALILGFALSLSSTAFAVQTLTERGQFNTEFGRSSFAILLMQDLTAIPALALIPSLSGAHLEQAASKPPYVGMVVIILLVIGSRFLIRPAFRTIAGMRSKELFTAATLFIVLGVAALMQLVGLSAALGTFIAGVLLADSEYRHEIETDLDPFKSLLLGLFFISVGMGVSLSLIVQSPLYLLSLSLGYLLIKGLLIYSSGRIFSLNHENAKLMALNIAQGGEFAFVIFGIAMQSAAAPTETFTLLTAVITISMALNPVISLINDRTSTRRAEAQEPKYDEIKNEQPRVILAGFGRFGQIFARVLRSQNIAFVAIDHDSNQIELVRKFGSEVYYGDVSRKDLLATAGAATAEYLVLAIDDVEASLETVRIVKSNFPNLRIFARARNRGHSFDLMDLGVEFIKRETFDSSAYFTRDLLIDMGMPAAKAVDIIEKFKIHDEIMLHEQYKVREDDKHYVSVSKQAIDQLAQVLNEDSTRTYIGSTNQPPHQDV